MTARTGLPEAGLRYDVAVIGGGPAGLVTALALSRRGASVLVVDRSRDGPIVGEGLPASAKPLLRDLGVWERFLEGGHVASYRTRSAWGSSEPSDLDSILNPHGERWLLDRQRFVAMLARCATGVGLAHMERTRVLGCEREWRGGWRLELLSRGTRWGAGASFVVDASGRARWLARALDAPAEAYDRLVGSVALLAESPAGDETDPTTLVEACAEGWWYATPLPSGRLVVGFMSDPDIVGESNAAGHRRWEDLLRRTTLVRDRVQRHRCQFVLAPRRVSADSSRLQDPVGDGWCAVGDAACAHDPMSSLGVLAAMESGLEAARALEDGSRAELRTYGEQLRRGYAKYLATWLAYYDLECRWPDSPFWRRRHALLDSLVHR